MYLANGIEKRDRIAKSAQYYNYLVTSVAAHLYYNGGNRFTFSPIRFNRGSVYRAEQFRPRVVFCSPFAKVAGRILKPGDEAADSSRIRSGVSERRLRAPSLRGCRGTYRAAMYSECRF